MNLSAIVATDLNLGIGKDNDLLFRITDDLKRFKELTINKICVMGFNTYMSLPHRPLPNRTSIVLTRDKDIEDKSVIIVRSIDELLKLLKAKYKNNEIMICGGGSIFKQLIPYCNKLYLTYVNSEFEADTFLEGLEYDDWDDYKYSDIFLDEESSLEYIFIDYKRIGNLKL